MSKVTIGVIAGSARKDAYSKAVARAVSARMPDDFEMEMIEIGHLPLYNQDFDAPGATPAEYAVFREQIRRMDGFLFATPEHNRSYPAALKNALDIASRPSGQNAWSGKPGAVISVSPGKLGAFGANHHLRQVLSFLNIYTMQQPEAYIGNIGTLVDEAGAIKDERTQKLLAAFAASFAGWVRRFVQ